MLFHIDIVGYTCGSIRVLVVISQVSILLWMDPWFVRIRVCSCHGSGVMPHQHALRMVNMAVCSTLCTGHLYLICQLP